MKGASHYNSPEVPNEAGWSVRFKESELHGDLAPDPEVIPDRHEDMKMGSPLPKPDKAWKEIMKQVRAVGRSSSPTFSHPAIGETVDQVGGWLQICNASEASLPKIRQAFIFAMRENAKERKEPSK